MNPIRKKVAGRAILDIAKQQSEEYRQELEALNIRVQSSNVQINKAQSQRATVSAKDELDKTLQKKSELELNVKQSRQRESVLEEEPVIGRVK